MSFGGKCYKGDNVNKKGRQRKDKRKLKLKGKNTVCVKGENID
jgi:hypothetical protein